MKIERSGPYIYCSWDDMGRSKQLCLHPTEVEDFVEAMWTAAKNASGLSEGGQATVVRSFSSACVWVNAGQVIVNAYRSRGKNSPEESMLYGDSVWAAALALKIRDAAL